MLDAGQDPAAKDCPPAATLQRRTLGRGCLGVLIEGDGCRAPGDCVWDIESQNH